MALTKESLIVTDYTFQKDYAFISYCSKNEDEVFNKYVVPLQENYGMRIFFDKNFKDHAMENWSDQMYDNITRAKIVIAFVSEEYLCSYACLLEILTALVHDVPIFKIQINQPKVSKDVKEKEISDSTRAAFQEIYQIISDDDKYKLYKSYYTKVKRYFDKGRVPLDKLSMFTNQCLAQIANTRINFLDGLEHIRNSINNELSKTDGAGNVFEDPDGKRETVAKTKTVGKQEEAVKKEIESQKEEKSLTSEQSTSSGRAGRSGAEESYSLYGKKYSGNQTEMMINAIQAIVENNPESMGVLADVLICLARKPMDQLQDVSYFRSGQECKLGKEVYSIGTSLGREAKLAQIRKAIITVGEDPALFVIEGLFNETQLKKAQEAHKTTEVCERENATKKAENKETVEAESGDETYTVFGRKSSGNQTDMMTDIISAIVEKNFEQLDEFADELTSVSVDRMANLTSIAYFRTGKEYAYKGQIYSVGTSFGREAKLAQIRKAILIGRVNPKEIEVQGLFNEKQLAKALAAYEESLKTAVAKGKEVDSDEGEAENDKVDLLCCFMSKFNDQAAECLGYRSINAAMTAYAEKWDLKLSTMRNIRDTFDPFFPESGRRGWWQKKDKISSRRKAIIDKFISFHSAEEAYEYICARIEDLD